MTYKISAISRVRIRPDTAQERTAKVSVTGDTAEEAVQICKVLEALDRWGHSQPSDSVLPELEEGFISLPVAPVVESPLLASPPDDTAENPLSIGDALASYLAAVAAAGRAPTTLGLYRCVLSGFAATFGPERAIHSIREAEISAYLIELRATRAAGSVALMGRILKGFFGWLLERGDIDATPMAAIKLTPPRPNLIPPFSDEEIHRLLDAAANAMERAIIALLVDTGLRASELTGLKLANIDFEQNLVRVFGKGSKTRTVALNHQPRQALAAYLRTATSPDGLLWPEGFNRRSLGDKLTTMGKRAGVTNVHPHRFRHTFSMRFLAETGNPLALQALLGHSSLCMVQRYIAAAQGDIALAAHKEHSPTARLFP